ncbi:hypothetical protein BHM03_00044284 [Ensete ventricosum]|nr:hypothetical protein BHM03_00044284 [Ensete ventricosum]
MDSLDFKVGELLKEIVLDDSAIEILDRAVSSVVDAIESIPEQLVSADAAPKFVADLGVPTDKKVSFTFKSPESIQVGGSYSIRSVAKPDINVDLLVRMPKLQDEVSWTLSSIDKCRGGGFEEGFSNFGNEPMLVGVLVSSQDKSFRVVDIGPNPENKEEEKLYPFLH